MSAPKLTRCDAASHQAEAMNSTSAEQNQPSQDNGSVIYQDEDMADALPSFDMEDWREVVAESSLWTVDLGDWWENPTDDSLR
jgi:hypothetical protein